MKYYLEDQTIYELLKNEEYIYSEITRIRDNLHTINRYNYGNLIKGLGLMLVFCPTNCIFIVVATLKEVNDRFELIMKIEREER